MVAEEPIPIHAYLVETRHLLRLIPHDRLIATIDRLRILRADGGRLFLIGNGGGAGHASHALCDFRKIARMDAYAFDNLSELTARINDHCWGESTVDWLRDYRFSSDDVLFVFSVGGGSPSTSFNLHNAIRWARNITHSDVLGICGSGHGTLRTHGDPIVVETTDTAQIEGIQAVLWHLIVTALQVEQP